MIGMGHERESRVGGKTFSWSAGLELKVWQVLKNEVFGLSSKEIAERIQEDVSSHEVGRICHRHPFIEPVTESRRYGRRWRALRDGEMEEFFKVARSLSD